MRGGSESPEPYVEGVLAGDRRQVAKTITLLESTRPDHVELGRKVLESLVPRSGSSVRLGISGPPGVGKSTLIETLGLELIANDHQVAVLAVDPSSPVSGGSILGDKTRMARLAAAESAFIRPSPSGGTLGGVAGRTREAMLVCEAAGFDVVIVETVGVGQSEAEVASMVDFFCVLLQPGAGDELQGIKKGVLELADALVVNKADGDLLDAAERTRAEFAAALQLLRPRSERWATPVLATSAHSGAGVSELWGTVLKHRHQMTHSGEFEQRRRTQARAWLWRLVQDGLLAAFRSDTAVQALLAELESAVEDRSATPPEAARRLLATFRGSSKPDQGSA
jgi:LAO/AO transport system kinase